MRIALGSDHGGYRLKEEIEGLLEDKGLEYKDFGTHSEASVDYPEYAQQVSLAVSRGSFQRGILVCGTGIGMSIAANRIPGVRAALCHNEFSARASRQHNDANVLTLGQRVTGTELALQIVETWLQTDFEGGRHQRRIHLFDSWEGREKE